MTVHQLAAMNAPHLIIVMSVSVFLGLVCFVRGRK
jgi:hypothetical protein